MNTDFNQENYAMSNEKKVNDYTHYLVLPLKFVGCWQWYPRPTKEYQIIVNNVYLCMVLFVLANMAIALLVSMYTEWTTLMDNLLKIADELPYIVSLFVVAYVAVHQNELYELLDFMNKEFVYHSAKGLTNMTLNQSYTIAKNFSYSYNASCIFSVNLYLVLPIVVHCKYLLCFGSVLKLYYFY